ncbi:MAG TPA: acyl-CoA dehydrogenase family protein [Actinophytocola sp.]|nr:acyl-CoA dehydrogenase family protein [Actinophytocola sp.]
MSMTTAPEALPGTEHVLDAVRQLTPTIKDRASDIEAARRLPGDLLRELKQAGCFRMLLPPSHGGSGVTLPDAMRVCAALGGADASVGWTVMIGSGAWCDLAGLPRSTFDALFGDRTDVIIGGAFNPSGSAVPVDGGYRVSGRWGFASGCEHCAWLYGNCVEEIDGEHQLRTVVFAPAEVQIEDTWTVSGLRGTGSHHFTADEVFVPAERTFSTMQAEPCLDEPLVRIPAPALYAQLIASTALGVAQGAITEILALAAGKVPLLAPRALAANPLFQYQLATADTELRAAHALLHAEAEAAWATATSRAPFSLQQRARIRATAVWATARAVAVVDFAYHAGGGSSLYVDSPLQRRLRDIHAITQHFLVKPDTLTTAGAVLGGQDIDVPVF